MDKGEACQDCVEAVEPHSVRLLPSKGQLLYYKPVDSVIVTKIN